MHEVRFNPDDAPIEIDIKYLGAITASYVYKLWEANSNAKVVEQAGNNQNSQDDRFILPVPVIQNKARLIEVFSTLKNPGESDLNGIIEIEICQDSQTLATIRETEFIAAGKTVPSQIFIKLIV